MNKATDNSNDGAVIADVLSGKTDRFGAIVRRYEGALRRVAKSRLGRDDWAEDVTQEAFLWAFKSLSSYDSRYSFRTWLWTILINQCRRHYQKRSRRPQVNSWTDGVNGEQVYRDVSSLECGDDPPSEQLLVKERAERLECLLGALPEAQADALRLRFYGGLKFHEIADAMGCSLSTAKNRVRWGLTKMSEQMVSGETP